MLSLSTTKINNITNEPEINIERTIDLKTTGRSKGRHIATIRKSEMIIIGQVNGCILYLIITKTVFKILKTSIEIPVDNAAPTISCEIGRASCREREEVMGGEDG